LQLCQFRGISKDQRAYRVKGSSFVTVHVNFRQAFVQFAIEAGVLRFGEFMTKSGRKSPYFFNSGLFDTGGKLDRLSDFYAQALVQARDMRNLEFDMLFGPAYKGITLAAGCAMALAARGIDVPFCFNRKEAKDHGEGGLFVGAPLKGRVVIVDDVITDGAAKREAVEMIRAAGAAPVAVLIALDRMERPGPEGALEALSSVQKFEQEVGIPVIAVATLDDLMSALQHSNSAALLEHLPRIAAYRKTYGI
jgi:orotate phosphoribosyltransferase